MMCWILKTDFHEINKTSKENNILNVCVSKSENPSPGKNKIYSDWHDQNLSMSRNQTDGSSMHDICLESQLY